MRHIDSVSVATVLSIALSALIVANAPRTLRQHVAFNVCTDLIEDEAERERIMDWLDDDAAPD